MGWNGLLRGSVESHWFDDQLHGLLTEPQVMQVAGRIAAAINR
jgi:hypothetical protein